MILACFKRFDNHLVNFMTIYASKSTPLIHFRVEHFWDLSTQCLSLFGIQKNSPQAFCRRHHGVQPTGSIKCGGRRSIGNGSMECMGGRSPSQECLLSSAYNWWMPPEALDQLESSICYQSFWGTESFHPEITRCQYMLEDLKHVACSLR